MHTIAKLASAAVLFATAVPASAANTTFTGRNIYGQVWGTTSAALYSDVPVNAFQNAIRSATGNGSSHGASVYVNIDDGSTCVFGYGTATDGIQLAFSPNASNVQNVVAAGSVTVELIDCYLGNTVDQDTVTFSINLTKNRQQSNDYWGTSHSEYGSVRVNQHYDNTSSRVSVGSSSVTSAKYGPVSLVSGELGQSRSHSLEVTK